MTFYNVISGILFLGACRAFLGALGEPVMWPAAVLVVTILNESVITSELIERQIPPVTYTLPMKLLDFLAFTLLSWSLLTLSPVDNTFDTDVSRSLWGAGSPRWFWGLLTAYWLVTLAWNAVAGQRDRTKWKPWLVRCMHLMWLPTIIAAAATWSSRDFFSAALWPAWLALACVSAYLLSKLFARAAKADATGAG